MGPPKSDFSLADIEDTDAFEKFGRSIATDPDHRCELLHGLLDHRSVLPSVLAPLGSSNLPTSAETFPCTSITRRALASSASARSARRRNAA